MLAHSGTLSGIRVSSDRFKPTSHKTLLLRCLEVVFHLRRLSSFHTSHTSSSLRLSVIHSCSPTEYLKRWSERTSRAAPSLNDPRPQAPELRMEFATVTVRQVLDTFNPPKHVHQNVTTVSYETKRIVMPPPRTAITAHGESRHTHRRAPDRLRFFLVTVSGHVSELNF